MGFADSLTTVERIDVDESMVADSRSCSCFIYILYACEEDLVFSFFEDIN